MPVDCSADALSASAACLDGISHKDLLQILVYLMATKAGVAVDADALLASSRCLDGIPETKLKQILVMLGCTLVNL